MNLKALWPLIAGIAVLAVGLPLDGTAGKVVTLAGLALTIYGVLVLLRSLRDRGN